MGRQRCLCRPHSCSGSRPQQQTAKTQGVQPRLMAALSGRRSCMLTAKAVALSWRCAGCRSSGAVLLAGACSAWATAHAQPSSLLLRHTNMKRALRLLACFQARDGGHLPARCQLCNKPPGVSKHANATARSSFDQMGSIGLLVAAQSGQARPRSSSNGV